MNRFVAVLCSCLLAGYAPCRAQVTQQTDHIYNPSFMVRAYELTAAQAAACFRGEDGVMSQFWYTWSLDQVAALDRVALAPPDHVWTGSMPTGEEDVSVTVMFAYSLSGIYALHEVRDDSWVGYVGGNNHERDVVDFCIEAHSAEELYANPEEYFPCLDDSANPHQLTESYCRIRVPLGGTTLVDTVGFSFWRPDLVGQPVSDCDPGTNGDGLIQYNRTVSFAGAEADYGIVIDVLPQEGNWRRQEWFIPWSMWGGPNAGVQRPGLGDKLAVCVGYNDLDTGQTSCSKLRWRQGDPAEGSTEAQTSVDAWGDILLDVSINNILDAAAYPPGERGCLTATRPVEWRSPTNYRVVSTEHFTITGRRIEQTAEGLRGRAGNTVLLRLTMVDESHLTAKVVVAAPR